ncbi:uncharacterized protein PSFLO_02273 [Pseudozyma flocculosa]|uniref:Uncharacterized protein n=1 Tax=Pseudozyma flocculosa TaxID=84751 RepID=A0A5C3EXI9_9BASI|nr:uncharacterized protein PSFLO_02273 [Pseudozyma flocculosa]
MRVLRANATTDANLPPQSMPNGRHHQRQLAATANADLPPPPMPTCCHHQCRLAATATAHTMQTLSC